MLVTLKLLPHVGSVYRSVDISVKKKVWKRAKLFIPAGQAKVVPPISSVLGQFGINLIDFCDKFNSKTRHFNSELIISTHINVFSNKTFIFKIKPISLNELFFSFNLDYLLQKNIKLNEHLEFFVSLYKLYLVFVFNRCIFINDKMYTLKTQESFSCLSQILGYISTFSRLSKVIKK